VFFSERKAFLLRVVNKENKTPCQGWGRDLGRESKREGKRNGREKRGAEEGTDREGEDINRKGTRN